MTKELIVDSIEDALDNPDKYEPIPLDVGLRPKNYIDNRDEETKKRDISKLLSLPGMQEALKI